MAIMSTRLFEQIGILYTNCWTRPVIYMESLPVAKPKSEVLSIAKASSNHILHDAMAILVHHFDDTTTWISSKKRPVGNSLCLLEATFLVHIMQ